MGVVCEGVGLVFIRFGFCRGFGFCSRVIRGENGGGGFVVVGAANFKKLFIRRVGEIKMLF
jgi:hypothetical protein